MNTLTAVILAIGINEDMEARRRPVYWMSPIPMKCDTCGTDIADVFYDEKTSIQGKWGCICPSCHTFGPGLGKLGLGWGQKFEKQQDGRWLKTEG